MIGLFREPMVIMKSSYTQSASGSGVLTWTDEMTIYAQATSLNFDRQIIANKNTGARAISVKTHYLEELTGLQEELGITYRLRRERNGRTYYYEILSVREITGQGITYMFTELTCDMIETGVIEAEESGVFDNTSDLDLTLPTVVSATVSDANPDELVVVFSESVNITNVTGLSLSGTLGD